MEREPPAPGGRCPGRTRPAAPARAPRRRGSSPRAWAHPLTEERHRLVAQVARRVAHELADATPTGLWCVEILPDLQPLLEVQEAALDQGRAGRSTQARTVRGARGSRQDTAAESGASPPREACRGKASLRVGPTSPTTAAWRVSGAAPTSAAPWSRVADAGRGARVTLGLAEDRRVGRDVGDHAGGNRRVPCALLQPPLVVRLDGRLDEAAAQGESLTSYPASAGFTARASRAVAGSSFKAGPGLVAGQARAVHVGQRLSSSTRAAPCPPWKPGGEYRTGFPPSGRPTSLGRLHSAGTGRGRCSRCRSPGAACSRAGTCRRRAAPSDQQGAVSRTGA